MIFECVILFLTLYTNWLIGVIFCLSYSPQLDLQQLTTTVERALGARANQYSRHGNTPPGSRPSSNTRPTSKTNNDRGIDKNYTNERTRPDSPPLLQRAGPQRNHKDMLNLHQDYQGRSGHLKYNAVGRYA